ncbi:MAG: hypothetical protein GF317_06050 [Candidatus Lokiarchaeota archaeon]|nr:hypothetical protein [Candidatus Lokiarchaeota archaeon]
MEKIIQATDNKDINSFIYLSLPNKSYIVIAQTSRATKELEKDSKVGVCLIVIAEVIDGYHIHIYWNPEVYHLLTKDNQADIRETIPEYIKFRAGPTVYEYLCNPFTDLPCKPFETHYPFK